MKNLHVEMASRRREEERIRSRSSIRERNPFAMIRYLRIRISIYGYGYLILCWAHWAPPEMVALYLVTALVPSDTACLANSPGSSNLTAVWISLDEMVLRRL